MVHLHLGGAAEGGDTHMNPIMYGILVRKREEFLSEIRMLRQMVARLEEDVEALKPLTTEWSANRRAFHMATSALRIAEQNIDRCDILLRSAR